MEPTWGQPGANSTKVGPMWPYEPCYQRCYIWWADVHRVQANCIVYPPFSFYCRWLCSRCWSVFYQYILHSSNGLGPIIHCPDSKVHGSNMGPTWVLSAPDGPHVGPMNLDIRLPMCGWSDPICLGSIHAWLTPCHWKIVRRNRDKEIFPAKGDSKAALTTEQCALLYCAYSYFWWNIIALEL